MLGTLKVTQFSIDFLRKCIFLVRFPDNYNKNIPASDSGSYKVPRKIWYSHVIRTSLGGSTQYGSFYLGEPLNLNYLGNPQGTPGGSGMPPKNIF